MSQNESDTKTGHDPHKQNRVHMAETYFTLRICLATIGILIPVVLWGWSYFEFHRAQPGQSISGYYWAQDAWVSDYMVSSLCATGVLLIVYRGFTDKENCLLNVAGACIIGVGLCPTVVAQAPRMTLTSTAGTGLIKVSERAVAARLAIADAGEEAAGGVLGFLSKNVSAHGTFAIVFFICLGCAMKAQANVELKDCGIQQKRHNVYISLYVLLSRLMILLPVGTAAMLYLLHKSYMVFVVEALGVWVFAIYWLVQTAEFRGKQGQTESALLDHRLADESPKTAQD